MQFAKTRRAREGGGPGEHGGRAPPGGRRETALHYNISYYTILYCIVLYYVILLYYSTVSYIYIYVYIYIYIYIYIRQICQSGGHWPRASQRLSGGG